MDTQQITRERLEGWAKKLALDNATPLVLVGIGHAHKAGTIAVCLPTNGPSTAEIAQVLHAVANQLVAQGN